MSDELFKQIDQLHNELEQCKAKLWQLFPKGFWLQESILWKIPNEYPSKRLYRLTPRKWSLLKNWFDLYLIAQHLESFSNDVVTHGRSKMVISSQRYNDLLYFNWQLADYTKYLKGYGKDYCEILHALCHLILKHVEIQDT